MTKYECDLCKKIFPEANSLIMKNTHNYQSDSFLKWDICDDCVPKIKETLGPGFKWEPVRYTR